MTTILKLGGSVITEKDEPETVDDAMLEQVVEAVVDAYDPGQFVVVHGGGSFGHHHAAAHGYTKTDGTRDATAVTDVHRAMTVLNDAVVDAFQTRDVAAIPVSPLSIAHRDSEGRLSFAAGQVATALDEGFLPVVQADPVVQEGAGVTILSGDEIVVTMAEALGAARVGLCSTVPGVLDEGGTVIPEIADFEAVADVLGGSDSTDVTGGMAGKVRSLLALSAEAVIFDPDALDAFLRGERVGTVVTG
jgi:isopentenyl phosphate kinase